MVWFLGSSSTVGDVVSFALELGGLHSGLLPPLPPTTGSSGGSMSAERGMLPREASGAMKERATTDRGGRSGGWVETEKKGRGGGGDGNGGGFTARLMVPYCQQSRPRAGPRRCRSAKGRFTARKGVGRDLCVPRHLKCFLLRRKLPPLPPRMASPGRNVNLLCGTQADDLVLFAEPDEGVARVLSSARKERKTLQHERRQVTLKVQVVLVRVLLKVLDFANQGLKLFVLLFIATSHLKLTSIFLILRAATWLHREHRGRAKGDRILRPVLLSAPLRGKTQLLVDSGTTADGQQRGSNATARRGRRFL